MSKRILIVNFFEGWRGLVSSMVEKKSGLKIVGAVSDGLAAVHTADELKPDLVLSEIGLPKLNGIEAARRIRLVSPKSKIVLLSADNSLDLVQAALSTGAHGFVHKARAHRELLPVIRAVLRNKRHDGASGPPKDTFSIFAGVPDRDAAWLETVVGLLEAQERMHEIASKSLGAYFIFHSPSHTISATLDTTAHAEKLRKTGY